VGYSSWRPRAPPFSVSGNGKIRQFIGHKKEFAKNSPTIETEQGRVPRVYLGPVKGALIMKISAIVAAAAPLSVLLLAACSSPALASSAAPASLTAQRAVSAESDPAAQSSCTAGQPAQWDLNGANEVDVAYDGTSFVYSATITQNGSCLGGTLDDPYYPTSGPISGTVSGDSITFTFSYPSGSIQGTRTYTGTISQSGVASGTWTQSGDESPDNGTWTLADKATTASTCSYNTPPRWTTQAVAGLTPGVEPLNVIISGCSNVSLAEIRNGLADWGSVPRWCLSAEKANVTGAYVDQQQSWRLESSGLGLLTCAEGNRLSLSGAENHVRIWNQPVTGSQFGAWFIIASYETACVDIDSTMQPARNYSTVDLLKFAAEGLLWHCIDGSQGSIGTDGYNRGAQGFVNSIQAVAELENWNVDVHTIQTPPGIGEGHDGKGVPFDGTVYVVTVDHATS
jgi:hypothetical protein